MKKKLQYDDFVKSVRPNPKDVEPNVLLQGYAGQSSEANHLRLYTDDALNSFIDLPEDAIIHVVANSKEENPLGGCKVWVKQSTVFTYGDPNHANRPKSSFLEGEIMENFQATNVNANPAGFQPTPTGPTCFGNTPICIGATPITCIGKTPTCFGRTPICIGKTPICIGTTLVTCITRTPTCFGKTPICIGRTPITCFPKTVTCFGRTPETCYTKTITCLGRTPETCYTKTITCAGRTPITCLGRTPDTGCGLNFSTGPITVTIDRTTFVQEQTIQVGTAVGRVTPNEDLTPYTPHTPVVKDYMEANAANFGFQEFNPYGGY